MTIRFSRTLSFIAFSWLALAALPAQADALDECWAKSENRIELGQCLRALKEAVDEDMGATLDRATKAQNKLDEVIGERRSTRALERAQLAFELYRNLECHVRELQAGSGTGSGDFFLGCWIDMTRQRTAALKEITFAPRDDELVGTTWIVENIEEKGVIDSLQSTLTFDDEEKISGTGGCNNFFGSVTINGRTIEFGPIGATRMACGEAIDDQEFRYFEALSKVRSYEFYQDLLLLIDADGRQILRLSRQP